LSNLYKSGWYSVTTDEKRIINSDERISGLFGKRTSVADVDAEFLDQGEEGFVGGLMAEQVEGLFGDSEERVIKGGDSADGDAGDAHATQQAEAKVAQAEEKSRELFKQAEEELAMARVEAAQIKEAVQKDIEVMKRVAAEEARGRGYTEGFDKGVAEIEKMRANLMEERTKLRNEYDRLVDELEPKFVNLLTGIYEQIFQVELKEYGSIVAHLITNTMRNSNENKDFIVRVARADYERVSACREEIARDAAVGKATLEIIADVTLASGECMIETGGGVFDCGLGTQLEGLNQKLRLLSYEQ
jgi:flagellar assembly protein FliH